MTMTLEKEYVCTESSGRNTTLSDTIVYAAGVFDILHYGHINYLQEAKSFGNKLIVGLLTDEGTKRYKYKYPVMNYFERYRVVKALHMVDLIVAQDDTDPTNTLKTLFETDRKLFPHILVRGSDVKEPIPGKKYLESKGSKVVVVSYTQGISSSIIKKRMGNG